MDTMRNAVSTAEKRPAYAERYGEIVPVRHRTATHEDEQSIDVVHEIRDHVFVVTEHGLLDELPVLESQPCLEIHGPR